MTVRRYAVAYAQWAWVAVGIIALMLGAGGWTFYKAMGKGQLPPFQWFFWTLWFGGLLYGAFRTLTAAKEIVVHEGDEIEFVSGIERQRVTARDIRSIRVTSGQHSQVVVRHASGKIYLAGAMNDFHQFVSELKQANPGVELVGC